MLTHYKLYDVDFRKHNLDSYLYKISSNHPENELHKS